MQLKYWGLQASDRTSALAALLFLLGISSGCASGRTAALPAAAGGSGMAAGSGAPGLSSQGAPLEYRSRPLTSPTRFRAGDDADARPFRIPCFATDSFGEPASCRFLQFQVTRVSAGEETAEQAVPLRATEDSVVELPSELLDGAVQVRIQPTSGSFRMVEGEKFPGHTPPRQLRVRRLEN